jgi:hypothetical protein
LSDDKWSVLLDDDDGRAHGDVSVFGDVAFGVANFRSCGLGASARLGALSFAHGVASGLRVSLSLNVSASTFRSSASGLRAVLTPTSRLRLNKSMASGNTTNVLGASIALHGSLMVGTQGLSHTPGHGAGLLGKLDLLRNELGAFHDRTSWASTLTRGCLDLLRVMKLARFGWRDGNSFAQSLTSLGVLFANQPHTSHLLSSGDSATVAGTSDSRGQNLSNFEHLHSLLTNFATTGVFSTSVSFFVFRILHGRSGSDIAHSLRASF